MSEILATLLPAIGICVIVWILMRSRNPNRKKKVRVDDRTRQERAIWAWAAIKKAERGPLSSFHVARVEMELEVHAPGSPAYPATVTWLVDEESLAFTEEGKELALKVDPMDLKYIYPNGSWARVVK
jgi:hypothetical protein